MTKDRGRRGARAVDDARARLERERDEAMAQLKALRSSPETDETAPRTESGSPGEAGDAAQASERRDMGFLSRERLAARIRRLTAALERVAHGAYGRCEVCSDPIETARLAALPEARTCVGCQSRLEAGGEHPDAA
ncbi:MAG: TraR/DksA family transcriptional regulator [Candidatus Rokuibacteriota bacterium]